MLAVCKCDGVCVFAVCFRCNKILSIFHFHALFTAALLGQFVYGFSFSSRRLRGNHSWPCALVQDRIEQVKSSSRGHDGARSVQQFAELVPVKTQTLVGFYPKTCPEPLPCPLRNCSARPSKQAGRIAQGLTQEMPKNGAEIHSRNAELTSLDETEICCCHRTPTPHASLLPA